MVYKKEKKKWMGKVEKMGENTFVASRQGVNFLALTWGCPKKYATPVFVRMSFSCSAVLLFQELEL